MKEHSTSQDIFLERQNQIRNKLDQTSSNVSVTALYLELYHGSRESIIPIVIHSVVLYYNILPRCMIYWVVHLETGFEYFLMCCVFVISIWCSTVGRNHVLNIVTVRKKASCLGRIA